MAIKNMEAMISWVAGNDYGAIVQHYTVDDTGSHTPFELARILAEGLESPDSGTAIIQLITEIMAEDSFISAIRTRQIAATGTPSFWRAFVPDANVGQRTGNSSPSQVAACMILLTAGDAGLTGRNFYGGVSVEDVAASRFTDDYKDAFIALADALIDGVDKDGLDFNLAIKHGLTPTFTTVVNAYLSTQAGTQRRRLRPI